MKHMTDSIAISGNHVKAFVAECCITGMAEDWSVSESIYAAYLSYCANNGHKSPLPKNVLSSTIWPIRPATEIYNVSAGKCKCRN